MVNSTRRGGTAEQSGPSFCDMEEMIKEALRYLGVSGSPDDELRERLEALAAELRARIAPRYALRVFELRQEGGAAGLYAGRWV